MDGKPDLTQFQRITFEAPCCCGLLLESSKGTLSQQNRLACVTAGSLQLLRALAFFTTRHLAKEQPLSKETDRTMMSMMPELELLETHGVVSPLLAFSWNFAWEAYTADRKQNLQGCSCALYWPRWIPIMA